METNRPVIYRITNLVTEGIYIGMTVRPIAVRWYAHLTSMRRGKHPSAPMNADFLTYGEGSFTVEPIEYAPDEPSARLKEWELLEQAITDGKRVYNMRHPVKCTACGKQFMGKRKEQSLCLPPSACWFANMGRRPLSTPCAICGKELTLRSNKGNRART